MTPARKRQAVLLAIVLLGAGLRFGALGYGLPRHDLGQDELITANRVRHGVLRGREGWPVFHWPNLNVYLSRAAVGATRWLEDAAGLEEHDDFLIGRGLTAALCTLTLVLVYLAGARLFDPATGLVAAAFLAVIPLHAFRSRLWVPDAPMTLFYTLALVAAVWILQRPSYPRFVLAGAAVGLATATKYNGVAACLPVVVAAALALPELAPRRRIPAMIWRLAIAGAASVVAFFAVNPLALSRFGQMLEGMRFVGALYTDEPATGFLGWHVSRAIASSFFAGGYEGVGPVVCTLAFAGWLLLLARPSRAAVLAWLPGLLYLLVYSSITRNAYERMFLPLTPHIALAAAVALVSGARRLEALAARRQPRVRLAAAIIVAVLLLAAVPVASHVVAARSGETRVEAANWMDANLPAGAIALREWDMIVPVANRYQINHKVAMLWGEGRTPESVAGRYDFVVTSSTTFDWVLRQRRRPLFDRRAAYYDALFHGPRFELAAKFEPDLFTFGPEIRVYRTLPPRGPLLGPGRDHLELQRTPWVSNDRLRSHRRRGRYAFEAQGEIIAGKARVRPAASYRLTIAVHGAPSAPLEIGFAGRTRRVRVAGERRISMAQALPAGQVWWRVTSGPDFGPGDRAVVTLVRLERVEAEAGR